MARITARNVKLFAGGRDISGRVNTATLTFSSEAPEVTTFGSEYRERLATGLKDYELSFAGFGDFSASQIDETMQSLMSSSAWYGLYPNAATASQRGREVVGIATNYSIEGAVEGAVGFSATITGCAVMMDMCSLAHTTASDAGASNLPSVNFAAANSGSCWHIFRILTLKGATEAGPTGPEISVSVQESANDVAWATIAAWESASSASQVFATSSGSCSQYRRVTACLSGTSPSATFMVVSGSAK